MLGGCFFCVTSVQRAAQLASRWPPLLLDRACLAHLLLNFNDDGDDDDDCRYGGNGSHGGNDEKVERPSGRNDKQHVSNGAGLPYYETQRPLN